MRFFRKQRLISLICALVFLISLPAVAYGTDDCSAARFKVAEHVNVEAPVFGMVVADFNADGHLDVVLSPNNSLNELIILFGRGGTQRFGPPITFPAGGPALRSAAADFNGDGKPDLAVSLDSFGQPSGRLSILLNDGTGNFGAPNIVSLPGDPYQAVVGDVNNDGKLDIVTGLYTGTTDGRVVVLLGNGSGDFSQAANSPFSTLSKNASQLKIGDFNEDGNNDLAIPSNVGGVDIWLGNGTGNFAAGSHVPNTTGFFALISADFNNDGHLDLLLDQQMLLGTGTGSFASPIPIAFPLDNNAAVAGDLNQDGHLDVIWAGPSGLTVFLGDGTGNFTKAKSYSSGVTVFGAGSQFAALGDFNEDGKTDVAAAQYGGIGILQGDGTGALNDSTSYQTSIPSPYFLTTADFNNDGKQDFAVATGFQSQWKIEVALGDGTDGFTSKSVINFFISRVSAIAAADFNGDGKPDLAVLRQSDGSVVMLLNDGNGGFPTDGFARSGFSVGFQPSAMKIADFNNDGKADVIAIASNSLYVLLGNGDGSFFASVITQSLHANPSFLDDLAIGDFNADGIRDVAVVRSGANEVQVLQGDGTGYFFEVANLPLPAVPLSVVAQDLNGDGKPDIAVSNWTNASLSNAYATVFINNGVSFNTGTTYATNGAGALRIGDFNNDSQPDLAMTGGSVTVGGTLAGISILTNKGNGDFFASVDISVGRRTDQMAVSDFNNDGKVDVLLSDTGGSILLLLNNFSTSQPCLSVNDVSTTEGDTGTTDAVFTVKLSNSSAQTVRVNYFVLPTSTSFNIPPPTKGVDFENVSGTVTFLPGETSQTVNVPIKGDLIDEFDQTFYLVLTTPVNAGINDGKGLGTIVDNDPPPAVTINDVAVAEGTAVFSPSSANFTLSLNAPSEKPISVDYLLQPGTASPGTDYTSVSGTVQFPEGTVTKTISVPITPDNIFEPNETFFVNLSNPTNATIADGQGQGTINNDDPLPSVSIGSAFRVEGAAGTTGNAVFSVTLSNPSYQTITVSYASADGSATTGDDYIAASGTVTFNPGETSKSITVTVVGDNLDEINETYFVNLSNPTNASISVSQGLGTIQDDDGPTVSIGSVSVTEGNTGLTNAVFPVTLSAPSVQDILVSYSTAGGTATSNVDFQRSSGMLLFVPAGTTSATITIRVFGDFQIESDEQFVVILQSASNATINNATGTGTIVNDDSNGKLKFNSPTYSATEDAGSIVVSVARAEGATGTVTVDYSTSNGTASVGSDYTATSGTLTFNQGEISKSFSIPIISDNVFESDETVNITLSNPTGGAILADPSTAILTIKSPPLYLMLEEALNSQRVVALDSLTLLTDPFPLIPTLNLLNQGADPNTRLILFLTNLQLAQGDVASTVRVSLVDNNGQSFEIGAEDVRLVTPFNFMQVTFRLPDNLAAGVCNVKVKAHDQQSNAGTITIRN